MIVRKMTQVIGLAATLSSGCVPAIKNLPCMLKTTRHIEVNLWAFHAKFGDKARQVCEDEFISCAPEIKSLFSGVYASNPSLAPTPEFFCEQRRLKCLSKVLGQLSGIEETIKQVTAKATDTIAAKTGDLVKKVVDTTTKAADTTTAKIDDLTKKAEEATTKATDFASTQTGDFAKKVADTPNAVTDTDSSKANNVLMKLVETPNTLTEAVSVNVATLDKQAAAITAKVADATAEEIVRRIDVTAIKANDLVEKTAETITPTADTSTANTNATIKIGKKVSISIGRKQKQVCEDEYVSCLIDIPRDFGKACAVKTSLCPPNSAENFCKPRLSTCKEKVSGDSCPDLLNLLTK